QHLLVMYAAAVSIPIIIGNAVGLTEEQITILINADLLVCGIATLIQVIGFCKIGIRLPLIEGCSFVAVAPIISIGNEHGMTTVYGSVLIAGTFCFIVAPIIGKIRKYFP